MGPPCGENRPQFRQTEIAPVSVSPPPMRPGPTTPPLWKSLLALICLSLSLLLWFQGLVDSLSRPSVGDALTLRQL